jgi:hypothetical protein
LARREHFHLTGQDLKIANQTRGDALFARRGVSAQSVRMFVAACVHAYSAIRGAHTMLAEHMPASHRAHREWSPAKLVAWGERIGVATAAVVRLASALALGAAIARITR